MSYPLFKPADLDTLWEAENAFFRSLHRIDWKKKISGGWRVADLPNQLTRIHRTVIANLQNGCLEGELALRTVSEQRSWTAQSARGSPIRAEEACRRLFDSQISLREAATDMDARLWLPWLGVTGCRTLWFTLEFLFYEHWRSLTEAHLTVNRWLPGIPARLTHIALDFQMRRLAGAVSTARRDKDRVWLVIIEGLAGGVWRFNPVAGGYKVIKESSKFEPNQGALALRCSLIQFFRQYCSDQPSLPLPRPFWRFRECIDDHVVWMSLPD